MEVTEKKVSFSNSFLECINVTLFQDRLSKENEQLDSESLELKKQRVSVMS